MDATSCERAQVERDEAAPLRVADVMLGNPKTLPADATVGAVREFFANPKVACAVLVDDRTFAGLLDRADLPATAPDDEPARAHAQRNPATITPDRPMAEAMAVLDADGSNRLVVLEADGATLAGLLCLDLQRAGFCQG